jgi:membrane dipeptidase
MLKNLLWVSLTALLLNGCSNSNDSQTQPAAPDAAMIAKNSIIIDTHIDVPYRLKSSPDNISESTESGDFDYPRAVSGGLNARRQTYRHGQRLCRAMA